MSKMDLFNNPMVTSALKAMTPEQVDSYKKMGEVMYKNMDKMNQENSNLPESFHEATAYIITGLHSGLHPRDMDINEIILLTNTMGEKWYEEFGYSKEDIPEVSIKLDDNKPKK